MSADEFCFELGFTVFEKQGDRFPQVGFEFLEGGSLRVGPWPAGNVADEDARMGISLYYCGEGAHWGLRVESRHPEVYAGSPILESALTSCA